MSFPEAEIPVENVLPEIFEDRARRSCLNDNKMVSLYRALVESDIVSFRCTPYKNQVRISTCLPGEP